MCRFALIRSTELASPQPLLKAFADMAEKSRAPDGDIQGDGWGAAWQDDSGAWQTYKSLLPVWQDRGSFENVPASRSFLFHARSASFPSQKGILEYNQPFVIGKYAFVFNGLLHGVNLKVDGRIGAQKIWNLVHGNLDSGKAPEEALRHTYELLAKHSSSIAGLNLGVADGDSIAALSAYSIHPDYYRLWSFTSPDHSVIASEPLGEGYTHFEDGHSRTL